MDVGRLLAATWLALMAGCDGPQSIDWIVRAEPEELASRVVFVEASIWEGGCEAVATAEATYREAYALDGRTPPRPPRLAPGTWAFAARGRSFECEWIVGGCAEVTLPLDEPKVETVMASVPVEVACAASRCAAGRCEGDLDAGPGRIDAGPRPEDAGLDAGQPDAGPSPEDAGPGRMDAGPGRTDAGRPDAGTPPGSTLDVIVLFDVTGSHNTAIRDARPAITSDLFEALLARGGVSVGIAYFADFPIDPFGTPDDEPFGGHVLPTADLDTLEGGLLSLPMQSGGDRAESAVEALFTLAGGTPHDASSPFDCPGGLAVGGCWRADAARVLIVITDVEQHNAPETAGGPLLSPYPASLSAAEWSTARDLLSAAEVTVFVVTRSGRPATQFRTLVTELGQDPDLSVVAYPDRFGAAHLTEVAGLVLARHPP